MALTPIQVRPMQPKKSPWDTVAQAMQIAGTGVGIANGIGTLTSAASPPPIQPPVSGADIAAYKPPAAPQLGESVFGRRLRPVSL